MKKTNLIAVVLATAAGITLFANAQNPAAAIPGANGQNQRNNSNSNPDRISDVETKDGLWDCSLPGGNYCVGIGKIISTSIHEYVVPSPTTTASPLPLPTRVVEANIITDGSMAVRFYFVESATDASALNVTKTALDRINQVANEAANRSGTLKPWQMVQKDYPLATHAHTVDFRVETREDLHRLYGSVKRAWLTGKGARFSVSGE